MKYSKIMYFVVITIVLVPLYSCNGKSNNSDTANNNKTSITEREPNNTPENAETITASVQVNGAVNSEGDQDDYFSFKPTVTGRYRISLQNIDQRDIDIYIIAPDATYQVADLDSPYEGNYEKIEQQLDENTEYKLDVFAYQTDGNAANYSLIIDKI
jgi:hypothetical protein